MATIQDFAKRIMQIEGVKNMILVRNDGHILTHNIDNPIELSSTIVFCGLTGDALRSVVGFSCLNYFIISRESKEKLFVFPIESYFLGIYQYANAYSPDLVNSVSRIVQALTRKKQR
jgi:hypothetical protein